MKRMLLCFDDEFHLLLKKYSKKNKICMKDFVYNSILNYIKSTNIVNCDDMNYVNKKLNIRNEFDDLLKYFSDNFFVFPKFNFEESPCYLTQNDLLTFFHTRRSQLKGVPVERFIIEFKRFNKLQTVLINIKENNVWSSFRVTKGIYIKPGISTHGGEND
jgi:hypothetical protein